MSRELDALVAEKVMGWELVDLPDSSWFANMKYKKLESPVYYHIPKIGISMADNKGFRPFHPSTDIAAAWTVVEKFLPHFRIEYYEDSDYTDEDGWHADFWLEGGHGCAQGCDTAPLAICRAALAAVEHQK